MLICNSGPLVKPLCNLSSTKIGKAKLLYEALLTDVKSNLESTVSVYATCTAFSASLSSIDEKKTK